MVNRSFQIRPLLPLLGGDGQYYVLALSQDHVRLFEGTREGVCEVDVDAVPQGLAEALKYDTGRGVRRFPYRQRRHEVVRRACGYVLWPWLRRRCKQAEHPPLLPSGGGRRGGVSGRQPDASASGRCRVSFAPLPRGRPLSVPAGRGPHRKSRPLERAGASRPGLAAGLPLFRAASRPTWRSTGNWPGKRARVPRTPSSTSCPPLTMAASTPCSWRLTSSAGAASMPRRESVTVRPAARSGDEDLLNLAAAHTLFNNGTVYTVTVGDMPNGEKHAALLRY